MESTARISILRVVVGRMSLSCRSDIIGRHQQQQQVHDVPTLFEVSCVFVHASRSSCSSVVLPLSLSLDVEVRDGRPAGCLLTV